MQYCYSTEILSGTGLRSNKFPCMSHKYIGNVLKIDHYMFVSGILVYCKTVVYKQ